MKLTTMITFCVACIAAILVPIDAAIPKRDHHHHARLPIIKTTEHHTKPVKATNEVRDTINGSCGDGCSWVLDTESGLLNISGNGKIVNKTYSGYKDDIKTVVINDGITYIGNDMFRSLGKLTKVTIADSVYFIGYGAFYECSYSLLVCTVSSGKRSILPPDPDVVGNGISEKLTASEQ